MLKKYFVDVLMYLTVRAIQKQHVIEPVVDLNNSCSQENAPYVSTYVWIRTWW